MNDHKKCVAIKLFVVLLVGVLVSSALHANTRRFDHLTSSDGISQSEVYAFLEDRNGFMWFGTLDGLNRYDGYKVEVFNIDKDNPYSLSNNTIRSLAEDEYGRIWIGTDDGLCYYDPLTELICQIEPEVEKFTVWDLLVWKDQLFIGTQQGLWIIDIHEHTTEALEKGLRKIQNIGSYTSSDANVRKLCASKHGGFWLMTHTLISRITFQLDENEAIIIDELQIPEFPSLIELAEDPEGYLWVISNFAGVVRYDPVLKEYKHAGEIENIFNGNDSKFSALAIDDENRLWLGTLNSGLLLVNYDPESGEIKDTELLRRERNNPYTLSSDLIFSLYVDSNNKLWVGTIGAGVGIFDPDQKGFHYYNMENFDGAFPSTRFVRAVFVDDDNRIWAGTHNNGLYYIDRENGFSRKAAFDNKSIFHICPYKDKTLFISSGEGLYMVDYTNENPKIDAVINGGIGWPFFYTEKGDKDLYWCASLQGIVRLNLNGDEVKIDYYSEKSDPAISHNVCRVILYDEVHNQLLVGTEGGGLNQVILNEKGFPKEIRVYRRGKGENSISNNYVRSIIKDENNTIWVGTYEGLNKVMMDSITGMLTFQSFTKRDGLPNNMIESLVEDDDNFIWIGTNGGLSKFDPVENVFLNYSIEDGLQSNEFSEHTVFKTTDGEIVIGGNNGINSFYPEQIKINEIDPRVKITDFYLNNVRLKPGDKLSGNIKFRKSILLTDSLTLSPKDKNIGFMYSAMIYPNGGKVKYAYKLEGFDEKWNYTGADNRMTNYTNLRHGEYIFKVKATNSDGIWYEKPTEVYIKIQTPFVYTWYAYLSYAIVFLLIMFYFSRYTVIRYTTKKNLLLEKEHNEKVHKLDELRTKFFINISHDLRTPLTLIKDPLDNILEEFDLNGLLKDRLLLIKRNVQRLNFLVEQLLDVRKAERGKLSAKLQFLDIVEFTNSELSHFSYAAYKRGIELKNMSEQQNLKALFDPAMISKVYFNLISNALKYTKRGGIYISITRKGREEIGVKANKLYSSYTVVEIKDTGAGLSEVEKQYIFDRFYQGGEQQNDGYGIGLSHSKDLIDAHMGILEVEGEKGVGTTVRFYLPDDEVQKELPENKEMSKENIYTDVDQLHNVKEKSFDKSRKTVLIVEDNPDMLAYLKDGLCKTYNVIIASDGEEGVELAISEMPEIILSDVMMPNMDGIELCKLIKTNVKTSHIPVILLTAKTDVQTKYEGIETGADDFILKPFEMKYLKLRINNLLLSREKLRELFQSSFVLEPSAVTVNSTDKKFLTALMEAIEENMSDPNFNINSLESKLGMSHSSFYRKVKSLTGQSSQELMLELRLKRGFQILKDNSDLHIAEVAYMVGFVNPKYFSKCFKEKYGYLPSEMKR